MESLFLDDQNINIDNTLREVCRVISCAETSMRKHIKLYYHNVNEEFITTLFYGHIKYRLRKASQKKSIENAFLEDLKNASYNLAHSNWNLESKAEGLIADIVLHNKQQEGKTGGDFGLIIVHPQIQVGHNFVEIQKGRTSGLLCQAKLKDKNGKWRFHKKQEAVLSNYIDFTSLVLYSYLDKERTDLSSVVWKLCRGKSLSELKTLLRKDHIENPLSTAEIINRLGRRKIGTENQTLIDNVVSPSMRQYLEIKIHWPGDNDPKGTFNIIIQQPQATQQNVIVKL